MPPIVHLSQLQGEKSERQRPSLHIKQTNKQTNKQTISVHLPIPYSLIVLPPQHAEELVAIGKQS